MFCNNFYLIFSIFILFIIFIKNSHERTNYFANITIPFEYDLSEGCSIRINEDLPDPQPLFLIPGTNEFWYPKSNGIIYIPSGRRIELYCSTSFNLPEFKNQKYLMPQCLSSTIFLINYEKYFFSDFECKTNVRSLAKRTQHKCANNTSILIEIGFQISEKRFLSIMKLCYNEIVESTLYVHYLLNPSSNSYQKHVPRKNFIKGGFFNDTNVNWLYTKKKQKLTIGGLLLGNHEKYFNEKKSLYLSRGHLSAKSDHIYGAEQRATFYYINVAPQWQKFNGGNWERIESSVRWYVSKNSLNVVDCYTGTWDVLQLLDINGNYQKLYLSVNNNNENSCNNKYNEDDKDDDNYSDDENYDMCNENHNNNNKEYGKITNYKIPVPKFYYRIVIDRSTKKGVALIGVNNPHATINEIKNDYILCNDVSSQIRWIKWKKTNILEGYSYACDVNEFTKIVNHLPPLDVKGLLI